MPKAPTKEQADQFADFILQCEDPELRCNEGTEVYARGIVLLMKEKLGKEIPLEIDKYCPDEKLYCVDRAKIKPNRPFRMQLNEVYQDPTI